MFHFWWNIYHIAAQLRPLAFPAKVYDSMGPVYIMALIYLTRIAQTAALRASAKSIGC